MGTSFRAARAPLALALAVILLAGCVAAVHAPDGVRRAAEQIGSGTRTISGVEADFRRGCVYYLAGDPVAALSEFDRAAAFSRSARHLEAAGIAALDAGRYPEAEAFFRMAVSEDSNRGLSYAYLAGFHYARNERAAGEAARRKALSLPNENPILAYAQANGGLERELLYAMSGPPPKFQAPRETGLAYLAEGATDKPTRRDMMPIRVGQGSAPAPKNTVTAAPDAKHGKEPVLVAQAKTPAKAPMKPEPAAQPTSLASASAEAPQPAKEAKASSRRSARGERPARTAPVEAPASVPASMPDISVALASASAVDAAPSSAVASASTQEAKAQPSPPVPASQLAQSAPADVSVALAASSVGDAKPVEKPLRRPRAKKPSAQAAVADVPAPVSIQPAVGVASRDYAVQESSWRTEAKARRHAVELLRVLGPDARVEVRIGRGKLPCRVVVAGLVENEAKAVHEKLKNSLGARNPLVLAPSRNAPEPRPQSTLASLPEVQHVMAVVAASAADATATPEAWSHAESVAGPADAGVLALAVQTAESLPAPWLEEGVSRHVP